MTASNRIRLFSVSFCLLTAGALNGCAAPGINPTHYQSIPPTPPKITFVRNQNTGPAMVIATVSINDWVVGTLRPGEYVSIQHEPGLHYITVKGKTVPLTFRNNREYFFLIEQDSTGATQAIRPLYAKDAAHYMENKNFHTSR